MAYATKAQLKKYIPELDNAATTYDGVLDDILDRVTNMIDLETGRTFGTVAASERIYDGNGTRELRIDDASAAPTQVRVRDGITGSWRVVNSADILTLPHPLPTGQPIRRIRIADLPTGSESVFPKGDRTVGVTAAWYAAVPKAIEQACLVWSARVFRSRGAGMGDTVGLAGDPADAFVVSKAMPAEVKRVLDSWRAPARWLV